MQEIYYDSEEDEKEEDEEKVDEVKILDELSIDEVWYFLIFNFNIRGLNQWNDGFDLKSIGLNQAWGGMSWDISWHM